MKKVYVYLKGWPGIIDMVSTDGMKVYLQAWDDYCADIDKEEAIRGFEDENSAFIAFMKNGGIDDWEVSEWEI